MSDFTFTLVTEAVDLLNDALVQIGREEVTAAGLDKTTANQNDVERICDRNFHKWCKYVLRQGAFRSISTRDDVNSITSNGEGGWMYRWSLPADFLRLNYIWPTGYWHFPSNSYDRFIDYEIEGSYLLSNVSGLSISYNKYPIVTGIADTATVTSLWNTYIQSWSETLRESVIAFISHKLCFPLKQETELSRSLYDIYQAYLQTAKMEDASQKSCDSSPDGPMVMARGVGKWL